MTDLPETWRLHAQKIAEEQAAKDVESRTGPRLNPDSGGGTYDGMEGRVTRLEVTMEHVRGDMAEIKGLLKEIAGTIGALPTRSDLREWKWQWSAIAVGAIAIIVGGIIGGLSWIKPDAPTQAAAPAPIVITVPSPAAK
jgi:hypothetical protein